MMHFRFWSDPSHKIAGKSSALSNATDDAPRATDRKSQRNSSRGQVYGAPFWLTYAANTSVMVAVSLLYRYSDFITFLDGTSADLGWIIGLAMVGALTIRLLQGTGVDRVGPRLIWTVSLLGLILSCLGHLFVTQVDTPMIYLLRLSFNASVAGIFGAAITYISRRAAVDRIAEVIGILGTSGFVGQVSGAALGDLLLGAGPHSRRDLDHMFLAAAGLGLAALGFMLLATRREVRPVARQRPPTWAIVRRYHPGPLLAVGVAVGFGLGLHANFIRPFAKSLGIDGIATFFAVYSVTAFITRITTRRISQRLGIRRVALAGLASMVLSILLELVVSTQWHLIAPAMLLGVAHALLFPSLIAGGSTSFPMRYRGVATALMLASVDLGNLVGGPIVGELLDSAAAAGLPAFPSMFLSVALIISVIAIYYAVAEPEKRAVPASSPIPRRTAQKKSHLALQRIASAIAASSDAASSNTAPAGSLPDYDWNDTDGRECPASAQPCHGDHA
jgi:MFS family permease